MGGLQKIMGGPMGQQIMQYMGQNNPYVKMANGAMNQRSKATGDIGGKITKGMMGMGRMVQAFKSGVERMQKQMGFGGMAKMMALQTDAQPQSSLLPAYAVPDPHDAMLNATMATGDYFRKFVEGMIGATSPDARLNKTMANIESMQKNMAAQQMAQEQSLLQQDAALTAAETSAFAKAAAAQQIAEDQALAKETATRSAAENFLVTARSAADAMRDQALAKAGVTQSQAEEQLHQEQALAKSASEEAAFAKAAEVHANAEEQAMMQGAAAQDQAEMQALAKGAEAEAKAEDKDMAAMAPQSQGGENEEQAMMQGAAAEDKAEELMLAQMSAGEEQEGTREADAANLAEQSDMAALAREEEADKVAAERLEVAMKVESEQGLGMQPSNQDNNKMMAANLAALQQAYKMPHGSMAAGQSAPGMSMLTPGAPANAPAAYNDPWAPHRSLAAAPTESQAGVMSAPMSLDQLGDADLSMMTPEQMAKAFSAVTLPG
jgi:hypothetical protein